MPTLNIRLNKEQANRLQRESDELGITRGSLIKSRAFEKVEVTRKPRPDQIQLRQILGQLGSIGNNLNQIAQRINTDDGYIYIKYINNIYKELKVLRSATLITLGIKENVK